MRDWWRFLKIIISKGSQPQTGQIAAANDDVFRLTFIIMAQDAEATIPHFLVTFFQSSSFPQWQVLFFQDGRTLIASDRRQLSRKHFYVFLDTPTPNCLPVDDKRPMNNWNTVMWTLARSFPRLKHKILNFERSRCYMFPTHYLLICVRTHSRTPTPFLPPGSSS